MDRQTPSALAHAEHPIAAPLGDRTVTDVLDRAIHRPDGHLLDRGCGEGAWLLRVAQEHDGITAVGVDISDAGFDATLADADRLGVADRLELVHQDVTDGVVVLGDCFWERGPSPQLRAELEDGPQRYADLATTVARVVADGWTPVHGHVSTPAEWDEYEWSWTGSLAAWALDHPDHPDRDQVLAASAAHRDSRLGGYRGVLGFVTLVLRPTP